MPTARIPIDLTWTGASGSPGANIYHARADSIDQFNADFDALGVILFDFYDTIKDMYCTDVTIRWAGEASGVGDDTGQVYSGNAWSVSGTNGTDHLSPALNVMIRWRTESGGAHGRGRNFYGPLIDGASESNGTPDEDVRDEFQAAADALVAASSGFGNGALGVYSRVEDVFRDFTSATVPNYFAILKSRRD